MPQNLLAALLEPLRLNIDQPGPLLRIVQIILPGLQHPHILSHHIVYACQLSFHSRHVIGRSRVLELSLFCFDCAIEFDEIQLG